jgi:hypothetical protein
LLAARLILILISATLIGSTQAATKELFIIFVSDSVSQACKDSHLRVFKEYTRIAHHWITNNSLEGVNEKKCSKELILSTLGREIIFNDMADFITIVPISTDDIISNTGATLVSIKNIRRARVTHVLWEHQNLAAISKDKRYFRAIKTTMRKISQEENITRWIFNYGSICPNTFNPDISNALYILTSNHFSGRFLGPDYGLVKHNSRVDNCQTDQDDTKIIANLWLKSIKQADSVDAAVRRESLLFLFR